MRDLWELVCDRWESDSAWREQIILAVIIGAIGLAFTIVEVVIRNELGD